MARKTLQQAGAALLTGNYAYLRDGGDMGARIREKDWDQTPLGPVDSWPQSLCAAVSICLNSQFPTAIYWGEELTLIYNDAWSPIPGGKHPWALGRPGREVWEDIWSVVGPEFKRVKEGKGIFSKDQLLPMLRHGFVEEAYFDYGLSPIFGADGSVAGVFNTGNDITRRLLEERRTDTVRLLTEKLLGASTVKDVFAKTLDVLKDAALDVPFVMFYAVDGASQQAALVASTGIESAHPAAPAQVDLSDDEGAWPLAKVLKTGKSLRIEKAEVTAKNLPGGPWEEPARDVVLLPMRMQRHGKPAAVCIAGISPRLHFDRPYHDFLRRVTNQATVAFERLEAEGNKQLLIRREQEAQAQLGAAFSTGSVGAWIWDVDGDKVIADANLAKKFGVDSKEAATGMPLQAFTDSIHKEDRPRVLKEIAYVVKHGGSFESEYRTVFKDGSIAWVMARGQMQKDRRSGSTRFPGVIIDITSRKLAEEAAQESTAQLKFMAESMPQKVFTATPDGKIDYFNPQWMEFTGMTFEQIRDWGWTSFIHPDDVAENVRRWKHSLSTGTPFQIEHRFRRHDGVYRWHLSRAQPMRNEKRAIVKWMGSNTDIQEQKQAEMNAALLARASKVLSSTFNHETSLKKIARMIVSDMADWCAIDMFTAPNSWKNLALTHKDPSRVKIAEQIRTMRPLDIDDQGGISQAIKTAAPVHYPEIDEAMLEAAVQDKKLLRMYKQIGFTSIIIVPIKVDGEAIGAISMITAEQKRQLTNDDLKMAEELAIRAGHAMSNARAYSKAKNELKKRQKLEAELRAINERLEMRVRQRTAQLEATNNGLKDQIVKREQAEKTLKEYAEDLARSNEELQSFAYVASHDLQEPLRKIQAFSNLLEEEFSDKLGDGKDYLDRMQGAATRMRVLIDDLLSFSRVATHSRKFVAVDLNVIAEEVAGDLETSVRDTDGKVEIGDLPTVVADATQMRQLLQNLIGNALKFHREGVPPVVELHAEPAASDDGERWNIFVKDNGIGFNQKYIGRIFQVFQRLHGRSTYGGTGIGLAVCRKIVERHDGTITAESTAGKGSTFIINLPAQHTESEG